ncbi:DUF2752 domain-containing protein [candidate division KSB1 bacterium]|nr:MAG: DUF2752 domain-containing protein [candidate division KSB1 bacterium]MBC6946385.1 DUF2752 domain-containing protein [candidate division KSB1 bacterium]MCE7943764.1 DUF2752 domain-containing protein [Chlorobi bacterium CHB1]MDL1878127.1 DUF2752 domain-containing protein [Cytophagia bacterium CHB2]
MRNTSSRQALSRLPLEAGIWLIGLIALACLNPYADQTPSLCIFHTLGLRFCPGCGLGHAIAFLFHGDFQRSFAAHPLGIPALVILSSRILSLLLNSCRGIRSFSKI